MQLPNTAVNSPEGSAVSEDLRLKRIVLEAKRRLAFYELNREGDVKPSHSFLGNVLSPPPA